MTVRRCQDDFLHIADLHFDKTLEDYLFLHDAGSISLETLEAEVVGVYLCASRR